MKLRKVTDHEPTASSRMTPTNESVNSAIQAYHTLPFVSAVILAFVSENPPCSSCQNQGIINAVAIINSFCVVFSLGSLGTSLLLIYQASKLLSARGAKVASNYLDSTKRFRQLARYCTYLSLLSYVLSFGVCLAGVSEAHIAWITSIVLLLGVIGILFSYNQTSRNFNLLLHGPDNQRSKVL